MPDEDPEIVQGIMFSEAGAIVENAFRGVLGMSEARLATLSATDVFGAYCDGMRLRAMLEYVRENSDGGLPSMTPPRTILTDALTGITTDSAIDLLIQRLSDFAFYFIKK